MEPRPHQKARSGTDDDDPDPLSILVTSKRMGLSFDELNFLTLDEYVCFVEMWVGDKGDDSEGPRAATQADIDRMLG